MGAPPRAPARPRALAHAPGNFFGGDRQGTGEGGAGDADGDDGGDGGDGGGGGGGVRGRGGPPRRAQRSRGPEVRGREALRREGSLGGEGKLF